MDGAFWFGAVIGWFLYFTNRYRKDVAFSDVSGLIGAIGGSAVTALFGIKDGTGKELFLSYSYGLAFGFFAYFVVLVVLVLLTSDEFTLAYLIDGRRKDPAAGFGYGPGAQAPVRNMMLYSPPPANARMRMFQSSSSPATAADHDALDAQHGTLVQQIDAASLAITAQYNASADPAMRNLLTQQLRLLDTQRDKIDALAIRADLATTDVQRAVAQLSNVTHDLAAEAQKLGDAAATLASAAKIVGLVSQAIGILAMLA